MNNEMSKLKLDPILFFDSINSCDRHIGIDRFLDLYHLVPTDLHIV